MDKITIKIKVYLGSYNDGVQSLPFRKALELMKVSEQYTVETLFLVHPNDYNNDAEIKRIVNMDNNWGPAEMINWFEDSDLHFFICHPHQGYKGTGFKWHLRNFYKKEIMRLHDHPGFPSQISLSCPIFTQDKFEYINVIPEMVLSTIRVGIKKDLTGHDLESINLFLDTTQSVNGWILKTPYSTNGVNKMLLKNRKDVFKKLKDACEGNLSLCYPYVLIQPKVVDFEELRVVFNNQKPQYLYSPPFLDKKPPENIDGLIPFAEEALNILKQRCPQVIVDGLVRVDVFYFKNCYQGKSFFINEFESLEACHSSPHGCSNDFLVQYWIDIISKAFVDANLEKPVFSRITSAVTKNKRLRI